MKHNVSPEIADELRENVYGWENVSDAEIALSMQMMGSNYEWYLSSDDVTGKTGVLILLHGFGDRGDKIFKDQLQPFATRSDVAVDGHEHDDVAAHPARARRPRSGGRRTHHRDPDRVDRVQHDDPAVAVHLRHLDEPSYATVPRVTTTAEISFMSPPNDDPIVAEMLLDHAMEISENPAEEVVIIAAHGPSLPEDNEKQLAMMANLAKIVQDDGGFAAVHSATLQDDAPPEVRDANVAKLRAWSSKPTPTASDRSSSRA